MEKLKIIFSKIVSKENRWLFLGTVVLGLILGLIFSNGHNNISDRIDSDQIDLTHDHKKVKYGLALCIHRFVCLSLDNARYVEWI